MLELCKLLKITRWFNRLLKAVLLSHLRDFVPTALEFREHQKDVRDFGRPFQELWWIYKSDWPSETFDLNMLGPFEIRHGNCFRIKQHKNFLEGAILRIQKRSFEHWLYERNQLLGDYCWLKDWERAKDWCEHKQGLRHEQRLLWPWIWVCLLWYMIANF